LWILRSLRRQAVRCVLCDPTSAADTPDRPLMAWLERAYLMGILDVFPESPTDPLEARLGRWNGPIGRGRLAVWLVRAFQEGR